MVWFQCPETRPWSGWWPHPLCRPDSQRGWRSSCSVLWSQQKRSLVLEWRICNVNRTVTYTFIQSTSVHAAISVCVGCLSKLLQYVVCVLWQNMKLAICAAHLGLANDDQEWGSNMHLGQDVTTCTLLNTYITSLTNCLMYGMFIYIKTESNWWKHPASVMTVLSISKFHYFFLFVIVDFIKWYLTL